MPALTRPKPRRRPAAVDPLLRELVDARWRADLTQQNLADQIGVSRVRIGQMEQGIGFPTLWTLRRWARALGFDIALVRLPQQRQLEPVCQIPDCGCTGNAHP